MDVETFSSSPISVKRGAVKLSKSILYRDGAVQYLEKRRIGMSSTLGLWAIYYKYYQVQIDIMLV